MSHWSENELLWRAMTPALAAPARLIAAQAEAASIAAAVQLPAGAAVLDLGCGAGPHAIAFASLGYAVTGVDQSADLLRIARARADASGVALSLIPGDMRQFVRPATFDLVCSLYSSFGYFDDETNLQILRNIWRSLRVSGALVLDVFGRGAIQNRQMIGPQEIGGSVYSVRRSFDKERSLLIERWTVTSGGVASEFQVGQRIYSGRELSGVLYEAGFRRVDLCDRYDRSRPAREESERLIAFAYR